MGSLREDEECSFFNAHEQIATMPGLSSTYLEVPHSSSSLGNWSGCNFQYDAWIRSPQSVKERRSKFLDWMGLNLDRISPESSVDKPSSEDEFDRVRETSDAVLRTASFKEEFSSSLSSMSCWSNDNFNLSEESSLQDNFVCRAVSEGGEAVCDGDEVWKDGKTSEGCEMSAEKLVTHKASENSCVSSSSFQQVRWREIEQMNKLEGIAKRVANRWLSRLRSITCVVDGQVKDDRLRAGRDDSVLGTKVQRVKVHQSGKRTKELSALYKGQDIQAHEGSILTMKFSPDGQYLASAGKDGVVRVWKVVQDQRCNDLDIPEIDPSCIYFSVNHLSELKPLFVDKEKTGNLKSLRKTSDSACDIFPSKVFRLLEKALHEFHGHSSEILDLSWSNKNVSQQIYVHGFRNHLQII